MVHIRYDKLPPCNMNEYQIEAVLEKVEDQIKSGFVLPEAAFTTPQQGVELVLNQALFLLRSAFFEDMYEPPDQEVA